MAQVEKEEFLKFLSKVYSEGFDAGMKCGVSQYSQVLNDLAENVKKISLDSARDKARALFEETMRPAFFGENENKDNVIDFASAKK